jgi:hypothetical protein
MTLQRFSEAYSPTGGLAAEGVLNQLGRPDVEPLEVLVREAVQNCWDARRPSVLGIRVEIGRRHLAPAQVNAIRDELLVDPPPGLPLGDQLVPGMQIMYFAVDFVRNIGQPPDKDLGGGSFGYGKAAFYIASKARTILLDTLCRSPDGELERRFIGCGLGESFDQAGRPHTGRHWWGKLVDGVPEPIVGADAEAAARVLGLPDREDSRDLGTTVVIVAPGVTPESEDGDDPTMPFVAEAVVWNFWPRMIDTPGGVARTMSFHLTDDGTRLRLPNPRTHPRLRGFVEAMDRLREEPQGDDDFVLDRSVDCLRPIRTLGRLVLQKGVIAPVTLPDRAVPQGARVTADSVHHVALMRNVELVVKYLPGAVPVTGRNGYSGVFRCAVDVDDAFRASEPPTHDDWTYRAVPHGHDRTYVKVALERIADACREAAGYQSSIGALDGNDGIPLGEFADALAVLMPGFDGPGARRRTAAGRTAVRRPRSAPGRSTLEAGVADVWVDGTGEANSGRSDEQASASAGESITDRPEAGTEPRPPRLPQVRPRGEPSPVIASDGSAVVRYPFELRGHGNRLRLKGTVEVMTNDGAQVESEAPRGYTPPAIRAWIDPAGKEHRASDLLFGPEGVDGEWWVEVPIQDEAMIRVDIAPELA